METTNQASGLVQRKLPFKIWHNQKCTHCSRTLCVGPVLLPRQGGHICGRCKDVKKYQKFKLIKSMYNVIACGFRFPCINCYQGCNQYLSIFEMASHENECKAKPSKERCCQFCQFKGGLGELLTHAKKHHLNEVCFDNMKVSFSLRDTNDVKKLLFFGASVFMLEIESTETTKTFCISNVTTSPGTRHFSIKVQSCSDPSAYVLLQNNKSYEYLSHSFARFEKDYQEFEDILGVGSILLCEVLMESLDLSEEEIKFQDRYTDVQDKETAAVIVRAKVQNKHKEVDDAYSIHEDALSILKNVGSIVFKCIECETVQPSTNIYICSEGHSFCSFCLKSTCYICNCPRPVMSLEKLKKFEVKCDWQDCNVMVELHYFISHKTICPKRPYACPLKRCSETIISSEALINHWHFRTPELIKLDDEITFYLGSQEEFYWMFKHDLYRVSIHFNLHIQLLIEEIDVLSSNNKLHCHGILSNQRVKFQESTFCGNFQIFFDNIQSDTHDFIFEKIVLEIEKRGF